MPWTHCWGVRLSIVCDLWQLSPISDFDILTNRLTHHYCPASCRHHLCLHVFYPPTKWTHEAVISSVLISPQGGFSPGCSLTYFSQRLLCPVVGDSWTSCPPVSALNQWPGPTPASSLDSDTDPADTTRGADYVSAPWNNVSSARRPRWCGAEGTSCGHGTCRRVLNWMEWNGIQWWTLLTDWHWVDTICPLLHTYLVVVRATSRPRDNGPLTTWLAVCRDWFLWICDAPEWRTVPYRTQRRWKRFNCCPPSYDLKVVMDRNIPLSILLPSISMHW